MEATEWFAAIVVWIAHAHVALVVTKLMILENVTHIVDTNNYLLIQLLKGLSVRNTIYKALSIKYNAFLYNFYILFSKING